MMTFQEGVRRPRGGRGPKHVYRSQILHPLTHRRWSLTATSEGELIERIARARRVGHDVAIGAITYDEGTLALEHLQRGRPAPLGAATVRDAWDLWATTRTSYDSRTRVRKSAATRLAPLLALAVVELTDARLLAWQRELEAAGYAPKYIRDLVGHLFAAVRFAKRRGLVRRIPWDEYRAPRAVVRRRPAATDDLAVVRALALRARADDEGAADVGRVSFYEITLWTIVLLGLRNGEAAGLGWDRLELELRTPKATIDVQAIDQWKSHYPDKRRPDFATKGRVGATLAIHPELAAMLREHRARLRKLGLYRDDGPVFPSTSTGALARMSAGPVWRPNANALYPEDVRRWAIEAGVPDARRWVTHSLRHSFQRLELRAGASTRAVQARARHASIAQTEGYLEDLELERARASSPIGTLGLPKKKGH